jgi:hypothetical protein
LTILQHFWSNSVSGKRCKFHPPTNVTFHKSLLHADDCYFFPPKHSIKKIELIFFENNNTQNDKILQDSILAQFQYNSKIVLTILYSLFLWTASNLADLNKAKTLVMLKFVIISKIQLLYFAVWWSNKLFTVVWKIFKDCKSEWSSKQFLRFYQWGPTTILFIEIVIIYTLWIEKS